LLAVEQAAEVHEASDGREALLRSENSGTLVILDLNLPGLGE